MVASATKLRSREHGQQHTTTDTRSKKSMSSAANPGTHAHTRRIGSGWPESVVLCAAVVCTGSAHRLYGFGVLLLLLLLSRALYIPPSLTGTGKMQQEDGNTFEFHPRFARAKTTGHSKFVHSLRCGIHVNFRSVGRSECVVCEDVKTVLPLVRGLPVVRAVRCFMLSLALFRLGADMGWRGEFSLAKFQPTDDTTLGGCFWCTSGAKT